MGLPFTAAERHTSHPGLRAFHFEEILWKNSRKRIKQSTASILCLPQIQDLCVCRRNSPRCTFRACLRARPCAPSPSRRMLIPLLSSFMPGVRGNGYGRYSIERAKARDSMTFHLVGREAYPTSELNHTSASAQIRPS
jgi:hypothetical protein